MKYLILSLSLFLFACSSVEVETQHKELAPKKQSSKKPVVAPKVTSVTNEKRPPAQIKTTASAPAPTPTPTPQSVDVKALEQKGDFLAALRAYVNLSVTAKTSQEQELYRQQAVEIVESKVNESQLKEVSADSEYGFTRAHAMFRLGEYAVEQHDAATAKKYYASVASFVPGSDLAQKANEMIAQIDNVKYVEPKTVGVVLPLSGKNSTVAQRALRGVEMGLGLHEIGSNFKISVVDSEGSPDAARRGVERIIREDNVIAVVGSLLSKTAPAVAAKANELGVPSIGLSQRANLTEIGPTVFRNSITSEMQIRHLVRVAIDDLGMRKFAVLYPNDSYGTEYANIFWDEVLARGGKITAAQSYNPKDTDFHLTAQRLVGTYYVENRAEEYKSILSERKSNDNFKKSVRKEENAEDILPPIVDFDAIFIPDSAKAMGQLSAFLSYVGVKNVKLLGTNLWNSPGLAKRAGNFADSLIFVDGFLSNSSAVQKSKFVRQYKSIYNEEPSLIEIQAYDSALMLRKFIQDGAGSREALLRKLTDMKNFPGTLGNLNMSAEREVIRPIIALTAEKGEIVPLKITK